MFVSVILDPGGEESARTMAEILLSYGFEKVQRACWESASVNDQTLAKLKQELDRVTDYYDAVRMYQFPVDGVLAVTILSKKKWKRVVVKPPQAQQEKKPQAARPSVSASRNPVKARPGVPGTQQSQIKRP